MWSVASFLLLSGIILPWDGGDAWPVIRSRFPAFHSFATYQNSNAYLYRGKNSDVYIRYPKSTSELVLPSYSSLIKASNPYQQSVLSSSPLLPYSPPILSSSKGLISEGIGNLKLFLSSPSLQHGFLGRFANSAKIPSIRFNPNEEPFIRHQTIEMISSSEPLGKQLVSQDGGKISGDRGMSESLQEPPKDNSDNVFSPEVKNNFSDNPKETFPSLHDSIQSPLIDNPNPDFNSPSDPPPPEPPFQFPSSSNSDAKTESIRDALKDSDLDFTLPSSNSSSLIDDFKSDPDFTFPIITNSSEKPDAKTPKIEDFTSPQSPENQSESDIDLLDILDKIGKADDKHRLEDSNSEKNQPPAPEKEPEMQSRQDSAPEQPSPFFPPAPQPPTPGSPQSSSFFPSPPSYQTSQFFPEGGNRFRNQNPPSRLQDRPQFPDLPSPPQFQTDSFFPGNNRFQVPNSNGQQQPQQQQPPSSSSPGNQDRPQSPSTFPGLPSPPQFQTDSFFPSNNRFQVPGNEPQSQQNPQFPPFGQSGQPFPRNFPGPPGSPPFGGPEPENGYNPNFMFEQFPEPPYESEFANIPEQDPPSQEDPRSTRGGNEEATPPKLDSAQSTLRAVKIDEILNVVQRKPVPSGCVYNSVSYGLNGEDCIQRKKRKK